MGASGAAAGGSGPGSVAGLWSVGVESGEFACWWGGCSLCWWVCGLLAVGGVGLWPALVVVVLGGVGWCVTVSVMLVSVSVGRYVVVVGGGWGWRCCALGRWLPWSLGGGGVGWCGRVVVAVWLGPVRGGGLWVSCGDGTPGCTGLELGGFAWAWGAGGWGWWGVCAGVCVTPGCTGLELGGLCCWFAGGWCMAACSGGLECNFVWGVELEGSRCVECGVAPGCTGLELGGQWCCMVCVSTVVWPPASLGTMGSGSGG